ncbi:hypothetical protein RDI58_029387 [Solanum bulbocastanum]|uniref:t-SNARE coiled-coil homology domain-containing protein n=1 Tax=Solanum bulbocastanum TaxID=147425 RepID=A0AAN8Y226_SOLBU
MFLQGMVTFGDSWIQEYNEAGKLADDITYMISERNLLPATGPEAQRHSSLIRRKITILGFRLDSLQSIDSKFTGKQRLTEKEMNRRKDMLANLKSKATEMASTLNMSNFANRDSLLGPETKAADATSRTTDLDNYGVVEQDEGLEKLEESMMSFKHIALAVNEELDLQTRLIDTLDEHADVTDSRLQERLCFAHRRNFWDLFDDIDNSSGEEGWNFEQTHKVWLLLLVHAFISDWDCTTCCTYIYVDQVSVIGSDRR